MKLTNLLSQIGPSNVNFDADSIDKAQIIESIINNNLKSYNLNLDIVSKKTNTTFYFGQYKSDINAYTIFKLNNEWYTCSTDEKFNHLVEGPYSNAEIIYIWSLDNNLNDLFEKYDFLRNHVNPYANIQRFNSFKEFSEYSKK